MKDKQFIFVAGLNRSGTSLLHEIIKEHPEISGFSNTCVPEDEGQHLQSVFEPQKTYGGAGKFAFDNRSYMDESHPLVTAENAKRLFNQWSQYYDLSCDYLVEKSPPNIIRSRFFQALFPGSKFIVILRHPLAVSYATMKWTGTSIWSLLDHSLRAYELFLKDMHKLDAVYVLRYEEFVLDPVGMMDDIFRFLELPPVAITHDVRADVNSKYFQMWEAEQKSWLQKIVYRLPMGLESRSKRFGYSINKYNQLFPVTWLGSHSANHLPR